MTAPLPGPGETTRAPGALRGMGAPPSSGAGGPGDDPGDNGQWGTGPVSALARYIMGEDAGSARADTPTGPPALPPPIMPPEAGRGGYTPPAPPGPAYEPGGGTMPPLPTRRPANGGTGGQRGRIPPGGGTPPIPKRRGVQPTGPFEDAENSPQAPSTLPALMQSTYTPETGYVDTTAQANGAPGGTHAEGTPAAQPMAADQVAPDPGAVSQSGGSGDDASNDKWMALLQAGLATLASNKPGLEAIGEGGQVGLESYRDSQRRRDRLQQQEIENQRANRGEGREDVRLGREGVRDDRNYEIAKEGIGIDRAGLDLRGELGRGELAAREKSLGLEAAGLSQRERIANVQAELERQRNTIAAEGNVLQQQGLRGQDLNAFYDLSTRLKSGGMSQADAEKRAMEILQGIGARPSPYGLEGLFGGRNPITDDQFNGAARP